MGYIMVVDDDKEILAILTQILGAEGYTVRAFDSGPRAIEEARRDAPLLALVDMVMPRMDGRELIRSLRAALGDTVPIIAISASARRDHFDTHVIQDFIAKPFDLDDLIARVGRFAHGAPASLYGSSSDTPSALHLNPRHRHP